MNKKIITIAEIVFALIFVVILALFMSTVTSKGNSTNTKLVDTLEMTDNSSIAAYEHGKEIKGESVKNAISQIKSIGGELKIEIKVVTLAGSTVVYSDTKKYSQTDTTKIDYINPSALFKCEQNKNGNDVITGLTFTQQTK